MTDSHDESKWLPNMVTRWTQMKEGIENATHLRILRDKRPLRKSTGETLSTRRFPKEKTEHSIGEDRNVMGRGILINARSYTWNLNDLFRDWTSNWLD